MWKLTNSSKTNAKCTKTKGSFCCFLVIFLCLSFCDQVSSFLTTSVQLAPGTTITGLKKNGYDAFMGVPFATPPVGNLRFRNPVPAPWWTGNRLAFLPRLYCWQFDQQILPIPPSGTEDCLYLNIFVPRVNHTKPLNVLVSIHGGGFYAGNNLPLLYGPEYFMETGQVILVTIAYRLNVFGFLSTGDEAAPGNYGLKDQTMALRWVRRHIGAFGGDPGAVTLIGQSAGSTSISYHLVSNHSVGLYHNAIMFSGTVEAPWGKPRDRPKDYVIQHAKALGITNAAQMSSEELVERFRKIPAKDLTSTVRSLYRWDILPLAAYLPVVEPRGSPEPFLTVHPRITLSRGDFNKVPVMTSVVHADGINFVQPIVRSMSKYQEFNKDMYQLMPVVLEMDEKHPNMTEIVDRVRFRYFGQSGLVTKENFDSVVKLATDYHFERPMYTTCQAMARYTPVYAHKLDYRGLNSASVFYTRSFRDFGVAHADDLIYLFRIALFPYQLTPADRRVQKGFMEHVISFIKYSNPGYPAWNVNDPMITQFRGSDKADLLLEQIDAEEHEFWEEIQDLYESKVIVDSSEMN